MDFRNDPLHLKLIICNTFTAFATLRRAPLSTKKIQRIQVGFSNKSRSDLFNSIVPYLKKISQSINDPTRGQPGVDAPEAKLHDAGK